MPHSFPTRRSSDLPGQGRAHPPGLAADGCCLRDCRRGRRSTQVPRRRGTRGVPPMTGFTQLTSRTVVLRERNIDTDQIIPARFLTTTQREGLGRFAFNDWRYLADGRPNRSEEHTSELQSLMRNSYAV